VEDVLQEGSASRHVDPETPDKRGKVQNQNVEQATKEKLLWPLHYDDGR
jgi:hypothetical protein